MTSHRHGRRQGRGRRPVGHADDLAPPPFQTTGDPYTDYQIHVAADILTAATTTTPEGIIVMTTAPPVPDSDLTALRQEVSRLAEIIDHQMPKVLEDYRQQIDALRDELAEVKTRPGRKRSEWQPDALDWQLIEILRHVYPMAVDSPALVSAGLACSESTALTRADVLADHGMIEVEFRNADSPAKTRSRRRFRALPEKKS
jgi:hypothetical protein